jgi:hypothetical protein
MRKKEGRKPKNRDRKNKGRKLKRMKEVRRKKNICKWKLQEQGKTDKVKGYASMKQTQS